MGTVPSEVSGAGAAGKGRIRKIRMQGSVWLRALLALVVVLALTGSAGHAQEKPADRIKVFVSILPQAYFVERVGGPFVDVKVLVGPGYGPHTYEPTPRQMADLAQAKVYFTIGVPFEKTLIKKIRSTFRGLEIVDTAKGIKLRTMGESEGEHGTRPHPSESGHKEKTIGHREGTEGHEHSHKAEGRDPHIWLDPRLVKIQAETICVALRRVDPSHAPQYDENLKAFQSDLDKIDARIRKVLAPFRGQSFFVFHPAYGYFADAYGLKQVAVETEGKEPSAREISRLIKRAKEARVKIIFVQPQFARKSAEALAHALDAAVVPMDPLARDYLTNLNDMAEKLERALKSQKH